MQTRETQGVAFQGGRHVAAVRVLEQARIVATEVLIPGSNRIDYKERVEHGPASIVFEEIYDDEFRAELERLVRVADNDEAKRKMRDAGQRELPLDLALAGDRQLVGAYVTWPMIGLGNVEEIVFPLFHAEL